MRKIYCTKCKECEEIKSLNYRIFLIKQYFFLVFLTSVEVKMNKYLKKNNQLKYQISLV